MYTMTEARDFEFDTQLKFANDHHKTTPRIKVGLALGSHIFAAAALSSWR